MNVITCTGYKHHKTKAKKKPKYKQQKQTNQDNKIYVLFLLSQNLRTKNVCKITYH